MIVAYFVREVRKLAGFHERAGLDILTPADQFRKVLERERARSDRTGESVSVIAFAPRASSLRHATADCLTRLLPKRLRSTDDIGWLDDQVACLLPGTAADGAWKVVDSICVAFPEDVPPPICTVYSYPDGPVKNWPALQALPETKSATAVVAWNPS